jgi:hypothetical protein
MSHEPPEDNPKIVWTTLNTGQRISADEVREKAQRLDVRTSRNTIVIAIVIPIMIAFVAIMIGPLAPVPVGISVVIMSISYFAFLFLERLQRGRLWSRALEPGAGLATCLDFYRKELERQHRGYAKFGWIGSIGPFLFGVLGIIVGVFNPRASLARSAPIVALMFLWSVLNFFYNRRQVRQYRRALDELDAFK